MFFNNKYKEISQEIKLKNIYYVNIQYNQNDMFYMDKNKLYSKTDIYKNQIINCKYIKYIKRYPDKDLLKEIKKNNNIKLYEGYKKLSKYYSNITTKYKIENNYIYIYTMTSKDIKKNTQLIYECSISKIYEDYFKHKSKYYQDLICSIFLNSNSSIFYICINEITKNKLKKFKVEYYF